MKNETDKPGKHRYSFLQRWSQRKLDSVDKTRKSERQPTGIDHRAVSQLVDENSVKQKRVVPDIESLTEESDLSGYFSEQVGDALRKAALRKIFRLDKFNICDGLDDYAEDYTVFEPLGNIITADLKLRRERERVTQLADLDGAGDNVQDIVYSDADNVHDADDKTWEDYEAANGVDAVEHSIEHTPQQLSSNEVQAKDHDADYIQASTSTVKRKS